MEPSQQRRNVDRRLTDKFQFMCPKAPHSMRYRTQLYRPGCLLIVPVALLRLLPLECGYYHLQRSTAQNRLWGLAAWAI